MTVIGDIPARNARFYPQKEAVVFKDTRLTFQDLNQQVNQMANALNDTLGIREGNRVATLLKNCHQIILAYFATQKIGAIFAPLNYLLTYDELAFMINDCEASTLFFSREFIDFYGFAKKNCCTLKNYISIEDSTESDIFSYDDLALSHSATEPHARIVENNESVILYTSGSTGRPKGVVLTHNNHIQNAMNMAIDARLKHNDITLTFLPLFASIPEQFFPYFYSGATNVILEKFNVKAVCEAIQKEKITNFDAVPTICIALIEYPEIDKYDFSSLTSIMYGSAPMPIEIIKLIMEKFPCISLLQAYGLTEAGPAVTFLKPEDQVRKIGSIGREIINVSVRVVDEEGNDLPYGEAGELICRSQAIMKGYYNLPQNTERVLKDGWLYTGDLVKRDKDGYFYIVGRIKDIIKSGGFGIAPAEVEEVLYKHPKVKEAAVIGVPHPKWGEAVHAIVVPKEGVSLSSDEILEFCEGNLAKFKKPKSVEILNELPKGAYGKIDKKILKDMYCN